MIRSTLSVLSQLQLVQDKTFDNSLGHMLLGDGRANLQAPMCNRVKVNTDVTLFSNLNKYSHAQVIRDHNGNLVEVMSKC